MNNVLKRKEFVWEQRFPFLRNIAVEKIQYPPKGNLFLYTKNKKILLKYLKSVLIRFSLSKKISIIKVYDLVDSYLGNNEITYSKVVGSDFTVIFYGFGELENKQLGPLLQRLISERGLLRKLTWILSTRPKNVLENKFGLGLKRELSGFIEVNLE